MKIVQINTTFKTGGSTGRIAYDLMRVQLQHHIEAYSAFGIGDPESDPDHLYRIQNNLNRKVNIIKTRLGGHHGFYNTRDTKRLINWLKEIKPDVIHLHNIHNHYVNVRLLFDYIKQNDIPLVWTLHDCWPFTGHCAYFDYANCDKWRTHCRRCPSLREYPKTWLFDCSQKNYDDKKNTFTGLSNVVIVTPSQWLKSLVEESFLKEYPSIVINNGVDTEIFKPNLVDYKHKLAITGEKMILSVASVFEKRKGIEYLKKLPELLHDDEVLVIVGVKPEQKSYFCHSRCITLERTNNLAELSALYSSADVFINPTLEDNFPTTNIEALSCGTPVVTFKTGGSTESVDVHTGLIVEKGNINSLLKAIRSIYSTDKQYYRSQCREKAIKHYNKEIQYEKYIELYQSLTNSITE